MITHHLELSFAISLLRECAGNIVQGCTVHHVTDMMMQVPYYIYVLLLDSMMAACFQGKKFCVLASLAVQRTFVCFFKRPLLPGGAAQLHVSRLKARGSRTGVLRSVWSRLDSCSGFLDSISTSVMFPILVLGIN